MAEGGRSGGTARLAARARGLASAMRGKGAAEILAGSLLMKLAGFLGSIVLARVMAKGDYGALTFVENRYTYAYLLAGLGLNNAVFRYLVLAEGEGERKAIFRFVAVAGSLFNVAIYVGACAVFSLLPADDELAAAAGLLPLMLAALPFQFLFDTCTYSLRALFRNRLYAVSAVLAVALVWGSKVVGVGVAGLPGAVLSWPATYALMACALLAYFHFRDFQGVVAGRLGPARRREMLSYSAQYMVTNGLWAAFNQNDMLLLGLLLGQATALADYKVAYAIPAALSILSTSLGTFVAPYFVRNESDATWVWRNYRRVVCASLLAVGGCAGLVMLLGHAVVSAVYGEQYLGAVPLMGVLLLASVMNNGIRQPTANVLAAMGRVRVNMVVSASGMALQILLDLVLIPRVGVYGVAWTSIVVYGLMAVAVTAYFKHAYGNAP